MQLYPPPHYFNWFLFPGLHHSQNVWGHADEHAQECWVSTVNHWSLGCRIFDFAYGCRSLKARKISMKSPAHRLTVTKFFWYPSWPSPSQQKIACRWKLWRFDWTQWMKIFLKQSNRRYCVFTIFLVIIISKLIKTFKLWVSSPGVVEADLKGVQLLTCLKVQKAKPVLSKELVCTNMWTSSFSDLPPPLGIVQIITILLLWML